MHEHAHTNQLIHETSPYLLQHAHNPVEWHAWNPETLELARREDRPIFLSIGYSTCYWCHVMERECFENQAIADQMNAHFVNIKVDREERPDLDQLYMTAVQLLTRSGGWPMSVFLTPDGRPFFGGTYFPPADYGNRPGFPSVLSSISDAWQKRRDEVHRGADKLIDVIARLSLPPGSEVPLLFDQAWIDNLVGRSISDYDARYGGFGTAPKFPRQTLLKMLLTYCRIEPRDTPAKTEIRNMLAHTLDTMARGGIRDQLGGGFHRYSTDGQWLIPHFEIMLYDNAMLLEVYAQAAGDLDRREFAEVARGIAEFVLGEMAGDSGEFFTAFDAEVDGKEGETYLWTLDEVTQILGDDAAIHFAKVYGLDLGPNFADPHHGNGVPDRNVLHMPDPLMHVAAELEATPDQLKHDMASARGVLLAARKQRKQPALDTKVLTSWNAMMIRGLAVAGRVLGEACYLDAARRAAEFLLAHHRTSDGGLYRSSRDGKQHIAGFLDDYAYFADALYELHRATCDPRWKDEAAALVRQMHGRFGSSVGAFYFTDAGAPEILVRQSVASDSPLPSGNAVAASLLLSMGKPDATKEIISAFADALDQQGEAYSALIEATILHISHHGAMNIVPRDVASELRSLRADMEAAVTASLRPLGSDEVEVCVHVAEGYHVNGPSVPAGLHPTRLLTSAASGRAASIEYPPTNARFPFGDVQVDAYEGDFAIRVRHLSPAAGVVLEVQPCSGSACLEVRRIVVRR